MPSLPMPHVLPACVPCPVSLCPISPCPCVPSAVFCLPMSCVPCPISPCPISPCHMSPCSVSLCPVSPRPTSPLSHLPVSCLPVSHVPTSHLPVSHVPSPLSRTGDLVADELAGLDVPEAAKEAPQLLLAHALGQVVDDQVGFAVVSHSRAWGGPIGQRCRHPWPWHRHHRHGHGDGAAARWPRGAGSLGLHRAQNLLRGQMGVTRVSPSWGQQRDRDTGVTGTAPGQGDGHREPQAVGTRSHHRDEAGTEPWGDTGMGTAGHGSRDEDTGRRGQGQLGWGCGGSGLVGAWTPGSPQAASPPQQSRRGPRRPGARTPRCPRAGGDSDGWRAPPPGG